MAPWTALTAGSVNVSPLTEPPLPPFPESAPPPPWALMPNPAIRPVLSILKFEIAPAFPPLPEPRPWPPAPDLARRKPMSPLLRRLTPDRLPPIPPAPSPLCTLPARSQKKETWLITPTLLMVTEEIEPLALPAASRLTPPPPELIRRSSTPAVRSVTFPTAPPTPPLPFVPPPLPPRPAVTSTSPATAPLRISDALVIAPPAPPLPAVPVTDPPAPPRTNRSLFPP